MINTPNCNSALKEEDKKVWNRYIENLFKSPEKSFKVQKGRDDKLKLSLDLHGMTIQRAFRATREFVTEHYSMGSRALVIICGKGGKIAEEFPLWCQNIPCIRKIEPNIDSKGECGSYLIILKK